MKQETETILQWYKDGRLTINDAQRQLFVLFGVSNSSTCKLDRLPKDCSIIQNTSIKSCDGCGHHWKN